MPLHADSHTGNRVLITGASGFVGSALMTRLLGEGLPACGVVHTRPLALACVQGPALESGGDWSALLEGVGTVVHTAARVHVMRDRAGDALQAFRAVNVEGSLNLARQAASAGVRRFVFISSIKVNGEQTLAGAPYRATDRTSPQDAYGISKAEAEAGLRRLAAHTGMEVVVIRPPLVYGDGVRGNFAMMMRALWHGLPLPLGAITDNRRSLVAVDNLVDLIVTCIDHPAAANQTFLVSDGEDLSTTALLQRLGKAMGKPARLLPIAPVLLQKTAALLGKGDMAQRLLGSLQLDLAHTRTTLGWTPPLTVDEGLRQAVMDKLK